MNAKQHHTHTAEKETSACACGTECKCGDNCKCHSSDCCSKFLMPATVLASAIIISGTILTVAFDGCQRRSSHIMEKPSIRRDAGIDGAIENWVKNNPKILIDSVEKHYRAEEAKNRAKAPQPQQTADKALVDEIINDKTNHVLGNPNGKFVIIEFFDYQCGWCKKTNKEISAALKDAPNIRWILMDTPIFGEASQLIARYAMAAGKQGKFKEYHEAIGNAKGKLDKDGLIKLGKDLKLNTKKLSADAESAEVKAKLEKNQKYARQLNINGVPMLIVDGKINPGALIGDNLAKAVEASKAKK